MVNCRVISVHFIKDCGLLPDTVHQSTIRFIKEKEREPEVIRSRTLRTRNQK
jgi:hypothetical protein